jgi:site-specific recombinase XerD
VTDPPTPRFFVTRRQDGGTSPYRLANEQGGEVAVVNEFLDATAARGLSVRTLRTYAFALGHAWRWLASKGLDLDGLTERDLVSFIQFLREETNGTPRSPRSINLFLCVFRAFFRFHAGHDLPDGRRTPRERAGPFRAYHSDNMGGTFSMPLGRARLRVKVPRELVVPLTSEQVADFTESLRTYRDLALVALMLFCGLRSRETIGLKIKDVDLDHDQIRVRGKGDKDRVLPLSPDAKWMIESYLRLERPAIKEAHLFLVIKGTRRGQPMTPEALRRIFRYHRTRSAVQNANPHRFRHTFASDMVNAGISLPALMRLMGHTQIEMTLRYVNLTAEDVREEFLLAARRRMNPNAP